MANSETETSQITLLCVLAALICALSCFTKLFSVALKKIFDLSNTCLCVALNISPSLQEILPRMSIVKQQILKESCQYYWNQKYLSWLQAEKLVWRGRHGSCGSFIVLHELGGKGRRSVSRLRRQNISMSTNANTYLSGRRHSVLRGMICIRCHGSVCAGTNRWLGVSTVPSNCLPLQYCRSSW